MMRTVVLLYIFGASVSPTSEAYYPQGGGLERLKNGTNQKTVSARVGNALPIAWHTSPPSFSVLQTRVKTGIHFKYFPYVFSLGSLYKDL